MSSGAVGSFGRCGAAARTRRGRPLLGTVLVVRERFRTVRFAPTAGVQNRAPIVQHPGFEYENEK
ncbi:hypothetical protein GZL_07705 [Streptomyces sp. 769]|nr:hypothetical protein GZL_07705 [Streptomyces sp. 769]